MLNVTVIINFSAAHRIVAYHGNCRFLHGHSYLLEASFSSNKLDHLGMVVDFALVKERLGGWIKENWDHNTILFDQDKDLGLHIEEQTGQKVFFMDSNPTCENMAMFIFHIICPELFKDIDVKCCKVKLYESSSSFAEINEDK